MQHVSSSSAASLPIGREHPWLAPLAGYSDLPFRLLCRELGASVACTEMVSAKGLVLGQGKRGNATNDLLATVPPLALPVSRGSGRHPAYRKIPPHPVLSPEDTALVPDTPLVVQLFGAEASFMEEAVRILADCGYSWFDLNMGCSVPKVGKSGSGSAMLSDPENTLEVARSMIRAAGEGRVGFKLRLGRQSGEEVYIDLAKRLEDAGAGWITLHPRYAKQKFSGVADWDAVVPLVEALSIPVIVSGDLFTPHDGVAALHRTGAAGVMFARGAMQNPAIFMQFLALMRSGDMTVADHAAPDASLLERVIRRHMALIRAYYPVRLNRQGVEAGLLKMRTFVPRYVKHCAGARALRRAMAECSTWQAMDDLINGFFSDPALLTPVASGCDADGENNAESGE